MLLEFLVRPPPWPRRGLGLSAGTLSLSCPLSRDSKSVDVTTESFSPQSRSPSSVLFSPVFTVFSDLWWRGLFFHRGLRWPPASQFSCCIQKLLLLFYKGALLPPIQPQNKYGFGITSLPCNGCPPVPVAVTSFTCFPPWFLFVSLPFLSVGMRVGRTPLTGPCLSDGVPELTGERFWSHVEIPLQNLHQHLKFLLQDKDRFPVYRAYQCLLFLEWVWCALL